MWIICLAKKAMYFVQFIIGSKELVLKATDNKKREEEIVASSGLDH